MTYEKLAEYGLLLCDTSNVNVCLRIAFLYRSGTNLCDISSKWESSNDGEGQPKLTLNKSKRLNSQILNQLPSKSICIWEAVSLL